MRSDGTHQLGENLGSWDHAKPGYNYRALGLARDRALRFADRSPCLLFILQMENKKGISKTNIKKGNSVTMMAALLTQFVVAASAHPSGAYKPVRFFHSLEPYPRGKEAIPSHFYLPRSKRTTLSEAARVWFRYRPASITDRASTAPPESMPTSMRKNCKVGAAPRK